MNKQELLKPYRKEEDRLLLAKVLDQLEFAQTKNKITNTDFLDGYEKKLVMSFLNRMKIQNYELFGGVEEAERVVAIFYSDKFNQDMLEKNHTNMLNVIQVTVPNELKGMYTHRDYLGGLMKLGIKREKIGDIFVQEQGAQILVLQELTSYIKNSLQELTRFSKATIEIKQLSQIEIPQIHTQILQIMVSSLRIDNIVAELSGTSRTKAEELIAQGRVFVNFELVQKDSKLVKDQDQITIRGKGRFKLLGVVGNTKKGRDILKVEWYG